MPSAIMECGDFSQFQEALKLMRRTDDIIVNTINSVVQTDSFHTNETSACKSLYDQLQSGYEKRENFIKNCINLTSSNLRRLKEQRESNTEDMQLSKQLRTEQTKLRMLQVELSVEDLVKERSFKVFRERCGRYYRSSS